MARHYANFSMSFAGLSDFFSFTAQGKIGTETNYQSGISSPEAGALTVEMWIRLDEDVTDYQLGGNVNTVNVDTVTLDISGNGTLFTLNMGTVARGDHLTFEELGWNGTPAPTIMYGYAILIF